MLENEISKKKKNSAETILKSLQKNSHWSIEIQLFGKFTNIGKSVIGKQNKKKFKRKFFIKSFSSFSNLPHPVKPTLLFVVKISRPCNNKKCPFLQHLSHFVIQHLTSNRTIDNFICTTQMTNTFAFTISINKKNLLNSVGSVGSVGQILAYVVWVAWVHKILAWVAWVKKNGAGQKNGKGLNVLLFKHTL